MDLSWRFDLWWSRLPRSPRERGRVVAIVVRPPGAHGLRERPERVALDPEGGVAGDRWGADPARRPDNQVSVINAAVALSLAADDPERAALCGDNLHLDLDLSEENLPPGTRLAIGPVRLEVTPEAHRPCRAFVERFGASGAKKVARAGRRGRRGRGLFCRVLRGGEIAVGDEVRVERAAG